MGLIHRKTQMTKQREEDGPEVEIDGDVLKDQSETLC